MKKTIATLLLLMATVAAADGPLQVQSVVQKEEIVVLDDGTEQTQLVDVTTVVPGDQVVFTITFTNNGSDAADAVTITDPVPAQMRYIEGSAFSPGADVLFSVDDGRTWGVPGELRVADADGELRRATPADYTHIRWRMRHALDAGKRSYARFRAALR